MIQHDPDLDAFVFPCPHCGLLVQVPRTEIRCSIFRHGVWRRDFGFCPPHASKRECDQWIEEELIWGCGKPFRFTGESVTLCGYI